MWATFFSFAGGLSWLKVLAEQWRELLIAALMCAFWLRGCEIERLETKAEGYDNAIATLKGALENNVDEMMTCRAVNQANAEEAERQRLRALQAVERAGREEREYEEALERIERDAEALREQLDVDCPDLGDPDFTDRLYDGP